MNGKGDAPRPKSVSAETFSERWERAFGRSFKNESPYGLSIMEESMHNGTVVWHNKEPNNEEAA